MILGRGRGGQGERRSHRILQGRGSDPGGGRGGVGKGSDPLNCSYLVLHMVC